MDKEKFKRKLSVFLGISTIFAGLGLSGCKKDNDIPEDVLTLKWYIPNSELEDLDAVLGEFNKKLYEKAGFKLELATIDGNYYEEKMKMNISSGDEFDLWFVGYLNPYEKMVEADYLYDITEMVAKSSIKDTMPEYVWEGAMIDGSIYAVPNYQVLFEQRALNIGKDLAEKYDLDISKITKTEDIEPFLQKIKENEPDLYPFRINFHEQSFQDIEDDFFYEGINSCHIWIDDNGELQCVPFYETEQYVEKIYKLREWYQKGYIRKDAALFGEDTGVVKDDEDFKNKMYAVSVNHYKPGGLYENKRKYGIDIEEVIISKPYVCRNSMNSTMIGINKSSKHPEEAFKLIEIINTDKELYNMLVFGLEGVHYEKIGKDRIHIKEDCDYVISAWKLGNQFNSYFIDDQSEDDWDLTKKLNDECKTSPFSGFYVNNENIKRELIQLNKVKEKYYVMLTGAVAPETYWEEMVSEYKEAGIEKVCEEVKRQAQEFIDSKRKKK